AAPCFEPLAHRFLLGGCFVMLKLQIADFIAAAISLRHYKSNVPPIGVGLVAIRKPVNQSPQRVLAPVPRVVAIVIDDRRRLPQGTQNFCFHLWSLSLVIIISSIA